MDRLPPHRRKHGGLQAVYREAGTHTPSWSGNARLASHLR